MIKYFNKVFSSRKQTSPSVLKNSTPQTSSIAFSEEDLTHMQISLSLNENINKLNAILGKNADVIIRNLTLGRIATKPAAIVYIDNMIDSGQIDSDIIRPLVLDAYTSGLNTSDEIIAELQAGKLITRGQIKLGHNFNDIINGILTGEVVILAEKVNEVFIISAKGYKYRNVSEAEVEPVVRGPREAFIEALSVNIALIRRRIHSPNLVFESLVLGKVGKVQVCMVYIKEICPSELYDEIRSRIKRINIDNILETSYIEEMIQDNPYSMFPQMRNTERPDVAASALMEGRVVILADNTPIALIAPGEFFSLMQSAEDYYNRFIFTSLIRLVRYFAISLATLLPAFYIAITNYHQEMLPTGLLESIIAARVKVPFPAFIEALIMEITFEILREAGVRLPKPMGQAVSIVGALVIGQAAVQANIVSPLMVIVVALTGIATFCIPQFNISLPIRILRFTLMILASVLGMFGVMIGILFIMLHLFSMESFGKPYMSPLAPLKIPDLKDSLVRLPWWAQIKRPVNSSYNSDRMKPGQIPRAPKKKGDQQ